MKRIYHTWEKWECYPAGLYETCAPNGLTEPGALQAYATFLRDTPRFESALSRVITEWPRSCEHYLSNETMNRIAWLGQAAMCIDTSIPAKFRGGFNALTEAEQQTANATALRALNLWLSAQGEPEVDMKGAGVNTKVNLY